MWRGGIIGVEAGTMCEKVDIGDGKFAIVCKRSRGKHLGQHGRKAGCYMKWCKGDVKFLCDGSRDKSLGDFLDEDGKGRCSAPICAQHAKEQPDGTHLCWHHERARLASERELRK